MKIKLSEWAASKLAGTLKKITSQEMAFCSYFEVNDTLTTPYNEKLDVRVSVTPRGGEKITDGVFTGEIEIEFMPVNKKDEN